MLYQEELHTNDQLIQNIASGDIEAFSQLYSQLYRPLLFFAENLIKDRVQSEDFTTSAFIAYWERKTQFASYVAVKVYMYKTVKHACYRHATQLAAQGKFNSSNAELDTLSETFIESRIIIAETLQKLRDNIEMLSPKYRDVIALLFLEECSIKEAAIRLSISEENVRKRKQRALELLRNGFLATKLEDWMAICIILSYGEINF